MTWVWRIFSSVLVAAPLLSATVSGTVELKDSRLPGVSKHHDFSGVVISLRPVNGTVVPNHAPGHARMVQKDKTFMPHVLAIPVGTTVDFPNFDPIFHNAFSNYDGQLFDIGLYAPGSSRSVHFTREGVVRIFCNIHSTMSALVVVLRTPYFGTTSMNGSFRIENVVPGEYWMNVFHERAAPATLQALEHRITVSDDQVVIPPIVISESGYLSIPHKNKYGRDYSPLPDDTSVYPATRK